MGKLLTQSEYARHRGVTKQYISGLVKQGRITLTNGKIAPDLADQQIKEQSDISHPKNRPADSESTINYKKARLRTLGYDTKMKKIQCEIMEGKWMLNAPIEKFAFEQGRRDRDAILALIDRYEHLYDNPKTQPKAIKMILKEIHDIYAESKQNFLKCFDQQAKLLAKQVEVSYDD